MEHIVLKKKKKVYAKLDKLPEGRASAHVEPGCLVLEGGAFRGLYSQGAMDAFMKHGLNLQTTIGVSAGALGGISYVSGQIGRSARANLGYRHDSDYIGSGAIRKSHSMIRLDFLLEDFEEIEPMDRERFEDPGRRFVAVVTNCETGETEYMEKGQCPDIMQAIKASASMPYVTPMVEIGEHHYLDGGCSCKIPYQWALDQGFEKILIIRTREPEFRKKVKKSKSAARFYRKYPEFAAVLDASAEAYNRQCDEIEQLQAEGRVFVLAPSEPVHISRVEGDMNKLGHLYWLGYRDAIAAMPALKEYFSNH